MKKIFFLLKGFSIFPLLVFGQGVPNSGFETWESGKPTNGWLTTNVPSLAVAVTQSSDAHTGSSSAKGETVKSQILGLYGPKIYIDFSSSEKPVSLRGFYKFTTTKADEVLFITSQFINSSSGAVATGSIQLPPASDWTEFIQEYYWLPDAVPTTCKISIFNAGTNGLPNLAEGTSWLIDDLSFSSAPLSVNSEKSATRNFLVLGNYPNPFNPSTEIKFFLQGNSNISIKVYNLLGQLVKQYNLTNQMAGNHSFKFDASDLTSGIYVYQISGGNKSEFRKMILSK